MHSIYHLETTFVVSLENNNKEPDNIGLNLQIAPKAFSFNQENIIFLFRWILWTEICFSFRAFQNVWQLKGWLT